MRHKLPSRYAREMNSIFHESTPTGTKRIASKAVVRAFKKAAKREVIALRKAERTSRDGAKDNSQV